MTFHSYRELRYVCGRACEVLYWLRLDGKPEQYYLLLLGGRGGSIAPPWEAISLSPRTFAFYDGSI
jgi:hypothetical protein